MNDIFISYSRDSEAVVSVLAEDIEALGHNAWFDQELSGGQAWWDRILETIRDFDLFIFVLDPASLNSTACKREYHYAAELGKPILPVLVSNQVKENLLPPALAELQYVDYCEQDRDSIRRLAKALNAMQAPDPLPDPLPPPPAVPISYLGGLSEQIKSDSTLSFEEQSALVSELRRAIRDKETAEDGQALLTRLRGRRDLLVDIAEEIDELLSGWEKFRPGRNNEVLDESIKVEFEPKKTASDKRNLLLWTGLVASLVIAIGFWIWINSIPPEPIPIKKPIPNPVTKPIPEPEKNVAIPKPYLATPTAGKTLSQPYVGTWVFKWGIQNSSVVSYHLQVNKPSKGSPIIDKLLDAPNYTHPQSCNLMATQKGWTWSVRAQFQDGNWSNWSTSQKFDIQPVDIQQFCTECPSSKFKNDKNFLWDCSKLNYIFSSLKIVINEYKQLANYKKKIHQKWSKDFDNFDEAYLIFRQVENDGFKARLGFFRDRDSKTNKYKNEYTIFIGPIIEDKWWQTSNELNKYDFLDGAYGTTHPEGIPKKILQLEKKLSEVYRIPIHGELVDTM